MESKKKLNFTSLSNSTGTTNISPTNLFTYISNGLLTYMYANNNKTLIIAVYLFLLI